MAKLTDEDKIANKAAQKIRDRAYNQRRSQYSAAVDAARARVEASPEAKACTKAMAAMDLCIEDRNKADAAILAQIEVLQQKRTDLAAEYVPILNGIKADRDEAWRVRRAMEEADIDEVRGDFPDVADVMYVGAWAIPAAVQAEMDKAAASAREAYAAEVAGASPGTL